MTFQRFNGDKLNEGKKWTEGYPIVYQAFQGSLENEDHPARRSPTSASTGSSSSRSRGDTLGPDRSGAGDRPPNAARHSCCASRPSGTRTTTTYPAGTARCWAPSRRKTVGPKVADGPRRPALRAALRRLDPRAGARYDGHPDLESVDMALSAPGAKAPAPNFCRRRPARRWSTATSSLSEDAAGDAAHRREDQQVRPLEAGRRLARRLPRRHGRVRQPELVAHARRTTRRGSSISAWPTPGRRRR